MNFLLVVVVLFVEATAQSNNAGQPGQPMGGQGPKGGPMGGPMSVPGSGPMRGPMSRPGNGPMSRPGNGQMDGPGNGPMSGPGNGPMRGPGSGQMNGPGNGPMSGPGNGPMRGPGSGQMNGPGNGPMRGPGSGPMSGPGNGPMSGPGNGPMSGPGSGPMRGPGSGPMNGSMSGLGNGPVSEPGIGPMRGPRSRPVSGRVAPGSVRGSQNSQPPASAGQIPSGGPISQGYSSAQGPAVREKPSDYSGAPQRAGPDGPQGAGRPPLNHRGPPHHPPHYSREKDEMLIRGTPLNRNDTANRKFIPIFRADNVTIQNINLTLPLKEGETIFLLPRGGIKPPQEFGFGFPMYGPQPYLKLIYNPNATQKISFEYGLTQLLPSFLKTESESDEYSNL